MDYIIDTIMEQIRSEVLLSKGFGFVRMSDVALLVFKGDKSLGIRYDEGTDLYDLTKYGTEPGKKEECEKTKGVYCDQLVDIISEHFGLEEAEYRSICDRRGGDTQTCAICGKLIRRGCATFVRGTRVNGPVHKQCFVSLLVKDV